jgi:hypothetical protein
MWPELTTIKIITWYFLHGGPDSFQGQYMPVLLWRSGTWTDLSPISPASIIPQVSNNHILFTHWIYSYIPSVIKIVIKLKIELSLPSVWMCQKSLKFWCKFGLKLIKEIIDNSVFVTTAYLQHSTHLLGILIKTFFGCVLHVLSNLTYYFFTTQAKFSFLVTVQITTQKELLWTQFLYM